MKGNISKRILLIAKCIFLLLISSVAYGVTARGTGTIRVEAINTPVITIDQIDFGDYVIGTEGPEKTTNFFLSNGAPGRSVTMSIPDSTIDLTSGANTCVVTVALLQTLLILDSSGGATGEIFSKLTTVPTLPGVYTGTVVLNVEYN